MIEKTINNWDELTEHIRKLEEQFASYGHLEVTVDWSLKRTETQSRCLHLYCGMVADELNSRGITFEQFFEAGFEVPWTKEIVKENIWKKVQFAVENTHSTKDLERGKCSVIYDILNAKMSQDWGLHIPWPSKESKNDKSN